jgi:hypothetical protein
VGAQSNEEAVHLVNVLRAELRLYARFGRPVHLGHVARGLESLSTMLAPTQSAATALGADERQQ